MDILPSTILHDIFDPAQGWSYTPEQVPLQKLVASDGSSYYLVKVDEIEIEAFCQTHWKEGTHRSAPAGRLVALTTFKNVKLTDASALLKGAFSARGLPSFGLDNQGRITLQAAFPCGAGFPVDLARKQLLVCMGIVAEEATDLLAAWTKNALPAEPEWKPSLPIRANAKPYPPLPTTSAPTLSPVGPPFLPSYNPAAFPPMNFSFPGYPPPPEAEEKKSEFDWKTAKNVASVAGSFLKAFLG